MVPTKEATFIWSRRARRLIATIALGAAVALAAACQSGGGGTGESPAAGSGSADVASATQAVTALEAPVSFTAPGPAVDATSALSGKLIYVIVSGANAAFVQEFVDGMKDAAELVGARVEVQDCAYDSTKAAELIDKGIAAGAAIIVTQSVDSSAVAAAIGDAKAAGIPVIEATSRDAAAPDQQLKDMGVEAISSFCYSCGGEQMAQFAVSSTEGNVHALLYNVPGVVVSQNMVDGFGAELAKLCPDCTVTTVDAPVADWESNLASLTTSTLQTNPNVNVLVPVFDSMVGLIEPAIASSGLSHVSVVTYNASDPALQLLSEGKLVTGDVGGSPYWLGWASIDQAARLAAGEDPVADVAVPHRLFDASNIGSIDLTQPQQDWYGDVDVKAEYSKLWGLS